MDNEPELNWNEQMRKLIREMIYYRKGLDPDEDADPNKVEDFETRYTQILKIAKDESVASSSVAPKPPVRPP
jgi:hypothetical protein